MKRLIQVINVIIIVITVYSNCFAITDNAGTDAYAFLKTGQGARASAMGGAYTGLSDDVSTLYWNPGGISQVKSRELLLNHTIWLESISKNYVAYIHPPFKFGSLGIGINYVNIGGEKRTMETDDSYEKMTAYDMAVNLVWGKQFNERLHFGSGLKFINENLDSETYSGIALDLGVVYKIDDTFKAGLTLQNAGIEMGGDDVLPLFVRAGVSKTLMENRLTLLNDVYLGLIDMTTSLNFGGEYRLNKYFIPRIGYNLRVTNNNLALWSGITAGFGIKIKKYIFEYAFVPYEGLGMTHYFDLKILF